MRVAHSRRRRAHHAQVLLHVGAIPPERHQPLTEAVGIDPRAIIAEVRAVAVAGGRNDRGIAAGGRQPDEGGAQRPPEEAGRLLQVTRGAAGGHDPLAIGRPGQVGVERRRPRDLHRAHGPAADLGAHDVPTLLVMPRDPRHRTPVGGPHRVILADVRRGDAPRCALREVLDPEPVDRGEHHALAIRRNHRAANLARGDHRRGVHPEVALHLGAHRQLDLHLERNLDSRRAVEWHPPELATVGGDDGATVRGVRVPRQHVHRGSGLLVITLHRVGQPALLAGGQLANPQPGLGVMSGAVDQPLPVGRDTRPERRAVAGGNHGVGAALPVIDPHAVLRQHRVVGPVAGAASVIHVAPVGGERRAKRLERGRFTYELEPAATGDVVHVDLVRPAQAAGSAHRDELAIGGPLR